MLATDHLAASIRVGGISLLDRTLRTIALCGVGRATVVTTRAGMDMRQGLLRPPAPKIDLSWIEVPEGASDVEALSAVPSVPEPCLVLRPDCIYDVRVVSALLKRRTGSVVTDSGLVSHGGLCLLDRGDVSQLTAQKDVLNLPDALARLLHRGEVTPLDIDDIPAYLPGLRKRLRPICFPVQTTEDAKRGVDVLLSAAQKGTLDFPARYLHPPLENWTTRRICGLGITPNQVTLFSNLLAFVGALLFAWGRLSAGILTALAVGILDGVDGKLARLKLMYSDFGDKLEHIVDNVYEIAWYAALAYHLDRTGASENVLQVSAGIVLFYLLDRAVTGTFKHLKKVELFDYTPFDRFFRGIGGRRNIYVLMLLAGILTGRPFVALEAVCAWAAVTFFVHAVRAAQHLLTRAQYVPSETS